MNSITKGASRVVPDSKSASANKVTMIVENIGTSLAAFIFGVKPVTVARWAAGNNLPKNIEKERRIEALYQVIDFMLNGGDGGPKRSNHEIRSWLMGMNPHLDDVSPAEEIRDGNYRPVMAAARAYAAGG